jgi:flagellar motility protein MotE (MotC chaperone)
MRIDPFLSPCTKLKSRRIKELHIKPETLKLTEEKVEKSLEDMGGHRGKILEQNSNGLCCKIKNQQMGPHKIAQLL